MIYLNVWTNENCLPLDMAGPCEPKSGFGNNTAFITGLLNVTVALVVAPEGTKGLTSKVLPEIVTIRCRL